MNPNSNYYNKYIKYGYSSTGQNRQKNDNHNYDDSSPCDTCCGRPCPETIKNTDTQEARMLTMVNSEDFGASKVVNGYSVIMCPIYRRHVFMNIFEPVKGSPYIRYIDSGGRPLRKWSDEMEKNRFIFVNTLRNSAEK